MFRLTLCALLMASVARAETPLPQPTDYAEAMRKVLAKGQGRPGVVLHIGDSITYSNPYGQWARGGQGKTEQDQAILRWMHAGANDDRDGWYLARFDHPAGGRSHTACSGIRLDQMLAGGVRGMPSLDAIITTYRPQIVVFMLGTNDASARRTLEAFRADYERAMTLLLGKGVVPIVSTIPPHIGQGKLASDYNVAIRELAKTHSLPLIDFEREILTRRADDWNGTLLNKNDVHPSVGGGDITSSSAPTAENLRSSGYLLRGWLSVQKIAEVKRNVIEGGANAQPKGESIRLPVSRDLWISSANGEENGNNGGANRLKFKSYQEYSLVDLDPQSLRGRIITGATLHLRLAGPERLHRVTVGTMAADWNEGRSTGYRPEAGSSSFARRLHPDGWWSYPGSDLTSVTLGLGGSRWRMADATPPDAQQWQRIPVDPMIVQHRIAGISQGFVVFDDTGSEWTRSGEKFELRNFPNRFVYSREGGAANAPYWTIDVGAKDDQPPESPTNVTITSVDEPQVQWTTPRDRGGAGVVGFVVQVNGREVPRYLIPPADVPGERVAMRLRDLGLSSGASIRVTVRAIDAAGNVGDAVEGLGTVELPKLPPFPGQAPLLVVPKEGSAKLGDIEIAVVDEVAMAEKFPRTSSAIWNPTEGVITLHAARNEIVGFRVVANGDVVGVRPRLAFPKLAGIVPEFGRCVGIPATMGNRPDPVVPITESIDIGPSKGELLVECIVPRDAPAGDHIGSLELQGDGKKLSLQVRLHVWDFSLPDVLSFLPEMNAYGLPAAERDYYRLAHRHRTVLNVVPYSQRGEVWSGCAPRLEGDRFDWTEWDRRFGPMFDGSAFADLPRKNVPIECFYLPIQENWPSKMADNYNEDYWADRAFPAAYRERLVATSEAFARHFHDRGWKATRFHFFLNGKNNFKQNGWSRGSSPWLLDEPAHFQDFWALRWYGAAFHEGVKRSGTTARMLFRADISRPQWQRESLDGLLDYNVVSSAMRQYPRLVADRKRRNGEIVLEYGTANQVGTPNTHAVAWCIDAWCIGADGVVPWQTIGTMNAWNRPEETSLFYPTREGAPVASLRLKSYRRGQQDVEYMSLLSQVTGTSREVLGQQVRELLKLRPQRGGTGFIGGEDAGRVNYGDISTDALTAWRIRIGEVLSNSKPAPRREVIDLRTPPRDPSKLAGRLVTVGEVSPPRIVAPMEPKVAPRTIVIQGPKAVRDIWLDAAQPDKALAAEPRNNTIKKRDVSDAFLLRIDPTAMPKTATIEKATISLFIWDPSSQGNTKLVVYPMRRGWDATATYRHSQAGTPWKNGKHFDAAQDAGPEVGHTIVKSDDGADTAEPPIEVRIDITPIVRDWMSGKQENFGVALVPIPDRAIDEGHHTRFQVYGSEFENGKFGPKLTLQVRP